MDRREYNKERTIAATSPLGYVRNRNLIRIDEGHLPESLKEGFVKFWLFGSWPGSFLTAVIRNQLLQSFAQADEQNRRNLFEIVSWVYNYGDSRAFDKKADAWAEQGGYFGRLQKDLAYAKR